MLDLQIEEGGGLDHEELTANRKLVHSVARTYLETTVKVDENRLKKQQLDMMPELLDRITAFEKTKKPTTVIDA